MYQSPFRCLLRFLQRNTYAVLHYAFRACASVAITSNKTLRKGETFLAPISSV